MSLRTTLINKFNYTSFVFLEGQCPVNLSCFPALTHNSMVELHNYIFDISSSSTEACSPPIHSNQVQCKSENIKDMQDRGPQRLGLEITDVNNLLEHSWIVANLGNFLQCEGYFFYLPFPCTYTMHYTSGSQSQGLDLY